jgi:hypothetical protein
MIVLYIQNYADLRYWITIELVIEGVGNNGTAMELTVLNLKKQALEGTKLQKYSSYL